MSMLPVLLPLLGLAAAPFVLVASQRPRGPGGAAGLDFSGHRGDGAGAPPPPPAERLPMRDGTGMPCRLHLSARAEAPVLLLLHGSSFHGLQFEGLGRALAAAGAAHVAAPDLRGHGYAPERRGDIDHVEQLAEDAADAMAALRARFPGAKLVLGGHSSGGGLVVRHAGGDGPKPDGCLLLAPYLGHAAPTTRPKSGGWARPLVRRIIGLSLLNMLGIRALNHLVSLEFATDPEVIRGPLGPTVTGAYSWRMTTGFAPRRDLAGDLRGLAAPTLLLVGDRDEAFVAEAYAPLLAAAAPGAAVEVLPGETHLGLVGSDATRARIARFLAQIEGAA